MENALIFHHRVKRFMQQHITASAKSHRCAGQHKGILGRVLHLLTRYEVQSRCAGGGAFRRRMSYWDLMLRVVGEVVRPGREQE